MRHLGTVALLGAVGFVALLGYGLIAKDGSRPEVGDPMPDVELVPLAGHGAGGAGSAGSPVAISDLRGKWVLVNLWASWCEPCRDEAPALQRLSERHAGELVVLGVDTNDLSSDALEFAREYGIDYPLLHDGEGLLKKAVGATGLPESYLVDPAGTVALRAIGAVDAAYLRREVDPLLAGGGPS